MIQGVIIDDERPTTEGLVRMIDWSGMGVDRLFTANCKEEAVQILTEESIDFVMTDIEMPRGSGFDLLAWIRDHHQSPVSIIITSHANFEYARMAIQYNCAGYLLKPISADQLTQEVAKIIDQVIEKQKNDIDMQLASYWVNIRPDVLKWFWIQVFSLGNGISSFEIRNISDHYHVTLGDSLAYLPILFTMSYHDKARKITNRDLKFFSAKILSEFFHEQSGTVIIPYEGAIRAILAASFMNQQLYRDYEKKSFDFVHQMKEEGIDAAVYIGMLGPAENINSCFADLSELVDNNVAREEVVSLYERPSAESPVSYVRPDIDRWMQYFVDGDDGMLLACTDHYLNSLITAHQANRRVLDAFLYDFMQIYYIAIDKKGVQANSLFSDPDNVALYKNADRSVDDFKAWITRAVEWARKKIDFASNKDRTISEIRQYISSNLSETLSRSTIADHFGMSDDYLSRLFHQKTGKKLMDYVTECRIEKSKQLLSETDKTIGQIAAEAGFSDITYFSKVFKIRTGSTPSDYRHKTAAV